jgi:hypothetical protein
MVFSDDDAPAHRHQVNDGKFTKGTEGVNLGLMSTLPPLLGLSVLAVIAVAAQRSSKSRSSRARRSFGYALVAVPLPLAVALHLFLWPASIFDRIAFVLGVVAFGAGALLVLASDDEGEQPELPEDPDPAPWWPDFERDFRAYARANVRPSKVPTP